MKVALEYRDLYLFNTSLSLWNQSKPRSSCSSSRFKFVLGRLCSTLFKREDGPPSYICTGFWNSTGLGKEWTLKKARLPFTQFICKMSPLLPFIRLYDLATSSIIWLHMIILFRAASWLCCFNVEYVRNVTTKITCQISDICKDLDSDIYPSRIY